MDTNEDGQILHAQDGSTVLSAYMPVDHTHDGITVSIYQSMGNGYTCTTLFLGQGEYKDCIEGQGLLGELTARGYKQISSTSPDFKRAE